MSYSNKLASAVAVYTPVCPLPSHVVEGIKEFATPKLAELSAGIDEMIRNYYSEQSPATESATGEEIIIITTPPPH